MSARDIAGDAAVAEAIAFLGQQSLLGLLWLDGDLIVRRAQGEIAAFVEVGAPVSESLFALIGQEESIEALKSAPPPASLSIPNVAMVGAPDAVDRPRLNIMLFWRREPAHFLVLLSRVMSQGLADRMIEDEIRKRRIADAELQRVNRQLEDFAYVISHDLKAPLRALRYYSDEIHEALAAHPADLDAVATSAQSIAVATRRMGNMLTGLLEYASLGRQQDAIETIASADMVDEIIASSGRPPGIAVSRGGTWPALRSAVAPLDLVLRNLVDNAIKHHDRKSGRIELVGAVEGANLVMAIVDDGPGIPPEWHEAIFEPFRRIDDERAPESSGIGLALVKRTVELAGGRIAVSSDPAASRGTTFTVTWPLGT